MDFKYIESFCESYFINHDLYRKLGRNKSLELQEEISSDIKNFMKELRENDIEFYNLAYDQPRADQRKILETYIDSIFLVEYNNQIIREEDEAIFEIEFGFISALAMAGIIYALVPKRWLTKMGRGTMKSLEWTIGKLNSVAEFLITNRNRNIRFRTAIITKNLQKCYKVECKVDPKDLGLKAHFKVRDKGQMPTFEKQKADCLRDCYLEHLIEIAGILLDVYFACLKRVGEFDKIQNIKDRDDIVKFITGTKLSNSCEVYYEKVKDLFDEFNNLTKFLFPTTHSDKKQYWDNRLRDKMIEQKKQVERGQSPAVKQQSR